MDINQLDDEIVYWEQVLPEAVRTWLLMFALYKDTPAKLLLSTMLATTSALVRKAQLQLARTGDKVHGNLFMLCLGESGCGKTSSYTAGCIDPIYETIVRPECDPIIDDTTEDGIFSTLEVADGKFVPIVVIDEAFHFFKDMSTDRKGSVSIHRMCRLYEGGWWSKSRGGSGTKRSKVKDARITALMYTTPVRFINEVWGKLLSFEDGLCERFLLTYVKKDKTIVTDQRGVARDAWETSPLKSLDTVYSQIFAEHVGAVGKVYTLSPEAENRLISYIDEKTSEEFSGSKIKVNAMKMVLNFHVLLHRITQAIDLTPLTPVTVTPLVIHQNTVDMALEYLDVLIGGSDAIKAMAAAAPAPAGSAAAFAPATTLTDLAIRQAVLNNNGPFVTVRRTYTSCSSRRRPSAERVRQIFTGMHEEGVLGRVKKVNSMPIFYKTLPTALTTEDLAPYGINIETYTRIFAETNTKLTDNQRSTFALDHPDLPAFRAYLEEMGLPLLPLPPTPQLPAPPPLAPPPLAPPPQAVPPPAVPPPQQGQ